MSDQHSRTALLAARAAGAQVRHYFGRTFRAWEKRLGDALTEADLAAEMAALAVLEAAFPSYNVVSEERGRTDRGSRFTWMVDPLDGTNNFVAGIPQTGVSIALLDGDEAVLGVVYQPLTDTLWQATRGDGAYRDGLPFRTPTPAAGLERALVALVLGRDVPARLSRALYGALHRRSARVLTNWAPSLDWCLLADGRLHALVSFDSELEDQMAGTLIAHEAGARIINFAGAPYAAGDRRIIAAGDRALAEALHTSLLAVVESAGDEGEGGEKG